MLTYIIQVILFQILFLCIYDFLLSKETFFSKNRFYLIGTIIISFILPLIKIPTIQKAVSKEYYILLPEIVLSPQKLIAQQNWYQSVHYLNLLFWIGVVIFSILFIYKLIKLLTIVYKNNVIRYAEYNLVSIPNSSKAFSFFNYVFLGESISEDRKAKIIAHELVHSKQKHSVDLLLFEFLKIAMWFNPMIWLYQKRISLVHEFLSDEKVSKTTEKETYINSLLSEVFQVEQMTFINQFYKNSLIKKRIIMMTKTKSKKVQQLKYLLLVPVLASMLLYTACVGNEETPLQNKERAKFYMESVKGKELMSEKETYMDVLYGKVAPSTQEYNFKDLTEGEKEEYLKMNATFKEVGKDFKLRVFEGDNGRKIMFIDMVAIVKKGISGESDVTPFSLIDEAPAFIGKGTGKKNFTKNLYDFVMQNFDAKIANDLGLKLGKKRIYVNFKIDTEGEITDIKVRAPHPKLKENVKKMMQGLPRLKPGMLKGQTVKVGYTLPITFEVN